MGLRVKPESPLRSSESGTSSFFGTGEFFRLFNDFSTTSGAGAEFTQATGMSVYFSGLDQSWDASFRFLATNVPSEVPEPAVLALFGAGLAGMGIATRRRRKTQVSA